MCEKNINSELLTKLNCFTADEQDQIYRYLWAQHVKDDVLSCWDDMTSYDDTDTSFDNKDLSDDDVETIVTAYVFDGQYDCTKSYWDNLEALIQKVITPNAS